MILVTSPDVSFFVNCPVDGFFLDFKVFLMDSMAFLLIAGFCSRIRGLEALSVNPPMVATEKGVFTRLCLMNAKKQRWDNE